MISNVLLHLKRNAGVTRTRAVIPWFRFFAVLIVIAPLVMSTAAVAADVIYTGDSVDLLNEPGWVSLAAHNSLFPNISGTPLSSDNKVVVNYVAGGAGMTNPYYVFGGLSQSEDADKNSVEIRSGYISREVFGGYSDSGDATNNIVALINGTVVNNLSGGRSYSSNATNNTVIFSDGTVTGSVFGGRGNSSATDNTVTFSSGTVSSNVYGGQGWNSDATKNSVFSSGTVVGDVYGGYSQNSHAVNNSVTISGGSVGGLVFGGYCNSGGGSATYNTVTITGGTMNRNIFGGYSYADKADNNAVVVSGGIVSGEIFGGESWSSDATNNTVTIMGNPVLSTSVIYGGRTYNSLADAFTGNTLNFKSSGMSVAGVNNFEYYNFYLPDGTVANDTMLSVANAVDLSGTTVEIFLQGSSSSLQAGDKVALINSAGGVSVSPNNTSSTASLGAFMTYDFSIYSDANNLWAELAAINNLLPSNVILTDSRLAPLAFLSQGADLVASLEYLEVSGDKRFNTFAIAGGGSSTYDTGAGAEVDVDGFSMLAGVMWNAPVNKNSLIVSAFFEAGWGSYDTYRDFGADGVVRGSGDSDYYGGGLHMRYKWDSGRPGGLYAEGSLRFGRNKSDFHTNDLSTVSDFSYDSSSDYFGAHVGLGYVWQLSGKTRLEAMSKYLWTRLGSDEVTASSGDRISFDSLNSSRWRAGFRMYHDYGNANAVTLYYGAMYEYEFGGDAEGRLGGLGLDGISPSGGSGIGELGVIFRPSKDNDRLTMQLGVQGYVGAREGVSGMLKLQYAF